MSRFHRLLSLAPFTLLTLSAACTQVLGVQDAWLDPALSGGGGSTNSGAGGENASAGAELTSAGKGGASGASHNHSSAGAEHASAGSDGITAGAGGADAPNEPDTCDSYCDSVLKNCKGKYEQYRTLDQCLAVCKRLPVGTPGDENVNSVECRVRQAKFAESEAFLYCKSAGPLGAGKCGSNCESYCTLMDSSCTQSSTAGNVELSYFESHQECLSNCAGMADDPTGPTQYSSSATIEPSTLIGNNVYCRTYHVAAGIEQDAPSEHCPHAMGGDPCIVQ